MYAHVHVDTRVLFNKKQAHFNCIVNTLNVRLLLFRLNFRVNLSVQNSLSKNLGLDKCQAQPVVYFTVRKNFLMGKS